MSEVMKKLNEELDMVLTIMDSLEDKTGEVYDELAKHAKTLGDLLNKNYEIEVREKEDASRKEVEIEKIALEREKIALEREKIQSEERKLLDKNETDALKSKRESTVKVVGIVAGVVCVVLGVLFGVQVLSIEKVATVSARSALNLAVRFLTAKPMFV